VAGKYSDKTRMSTCQNCLAGKYSINVIRSDDPTYRSPWYRNFYPCAAYADGHPNDNYCVVDEACDPCFVTCAQECGHILPSYSTPTSCTDCAAGTFSPAAASVCTNCPVSSTSPAASTSISSCACNSGYDAFTTGNYEEPGSFYCQASLCNAELSKLL
jgi:hypothetical protein